MTVPMTVTGSIIGYKLVNCDPSGIECTLGPVLFDLKFTGRGESTVTFDAGGNIAGESTSFTGTAAVVPEPFSLLLTGTGLVGVWIRTKMAQNK
jgi:hypothetical protein